MKKFFISIASAAVVLSTVACAALQNVDAPPLSPSSNGALLTTVEGNHTAVQSASAEQTIGMNLDALQKIAGAQYAGTWWEYEGSSPTYQVVAVTGPVDIDPKLAAQLRLKIVYVRYSYQALLATQYRIAEAFMPNNGLVFRVFIDELKNKLLLQAGKKDLETLREQLKKQNFDMEMLILELPADTVTLF